MSKSAGFGGYRQNVTTEQSFQMGAVDRNKNNSVIMD
jgi:hypothetical protein